MPPTTAQPALARSASKSMLGGKTVVGQTSPVHDPALIIDDDGTWYVYSTGLVHRENGGTIQIWSSHDRGTTWKYTGTVWDRIPTWIDQHFADGALPDNLWAPEIHKHGGTYFLYYSASRFGGNNSLTALATNTTLDPTDPHYQWVDRGLVVSSPVTGLDPAVPDKTFNAIDPGIVEADGRPYLAIGSFWYGIFLVPLEWPSGKPVANWQAQTRNLADRHVEFNPIEAPYITKHGGYYYLFVSFDFCCRGADSTYKIAVGRSRSVKGPYLDKSGQDMLTGGGSVVLDRHGAIVGPGGQSVFGDYLAFHYYDASNQANPFIPTLGIQRIDWSSGWPSFDQRVQVPTVISGPHPVTVRVGQHAIFTARATGIPAPVAVWEKSTDGGDTWAALAKQPRTRPAKGGSYRSTLVVSDVTRATSRLQVRAVFQNAHGTAATQAVRLSAVPPAHDR